MSDPKPQLYDQGYGDTSPEWTEQFGAALAEQKARLATLMPFLDPNLRRERQAEAEAAAEAERQAAWPDARQALRQAHAELATALAELRRRQEAATRGATVLDRARDVLRSAQLAHGQVTESATTLLRQAIERGEDLPATGEGEECELLDAVD